MREQRKGVSWIIIIVVCFLITFVLNLVQGIRTATAGLEVPYDLF